MARNSSGTYSLPSGNPVITNTKITSTWANNTMSDIANEITNSLDRNGRGRMAVPILQPDGALSTPAFSFINDPDTGMRLSAVGVMAFTVGGVDQLAMSLAGVTTGTQATGTNNVLLATTAFVQQEILANHGRFLGVRVFSATQVYTPSTGTTRILAFVQGGGGAGGGTVATGVAQQACGAGGGAGGWAMSYLTSGFSGVTMTIGAAGVAALGASGGNGGTTSFGGIFAATGGQGGGVGGALGTSSTAFAQGSGGGTGGSGNFINSVGGAGGNGLYTPAGGVLSGNGGYSYFGQGGNSVQLANGSTATVIGAGGGGAAQQASGGALTGGGGAIGCVLIWEFF